MMRRDGNDAIDDDDDTDDEKEEKEKGDDNYEKGHWSWHVTSIIFLLLYNIENEKTK